MKTFRLALIALLSIIGSALFAQSFENMPETRSGKNPFVNLSWELYLRRTDVNAKFTPAYGGFTFNAKFRADAFEKGDWRWHFENPTLGDLVFVLMNAKKIRDTKNTNGGAEQSFGSGFFGWHQIYWNVVAQDNLLVSPGISLGDYIFASQRPAGTTNADQTILDPAGYFFHAGPALMVSKLFTETLWVNAYTRYDLTTRAGKLGANYLETPGYKKPHFFAIGASVQHGKSRLCGGINYTHMIDRGGNKDSASRMDISVGLMF
jgi:hypothetical protein